MTTSAKLGADCLLKKKINYSWLLRCKEGNTIRLNACRRLSSMYSPMSVPTWITPAFTEERKRIRSRPVSSDEVPKLRHAMSVWPQHMELIPSDSSKRDVWAWIGLAACGRAMFHQSRRTLIYATPPYCHFSRQKLIQCSLSFRQSSRPWPCCTRTCLHGQCGSPNIWPLGSRSEDRVFTANCRRSLRTYQQTDVVTLAVTEVMFIYLKGLTQLSIRFELR